MLPNSRNQTYISGVTPVAANDMNDLQDQVIAVNKLVTGQPQANWTNVALAGNLTVGGQLYSFNDFTFTADAGTDQLTATGHPLQTGDGPLRNTNSGGGPPGNLPLATDWYAIFVDANHIKAATTRANALAGIAIDISSNGSGTQTVAHQAGTTRVSDAEVTRTLTVDGNATVGGTLGVTGAITPSGGIAGAVSFNGDVTVAAGHSLTITDGASALRGMTYATTRAFNVNEMIAVSGSAMSTNTVDHRVGVVGGATTIARYTVDWGSHQTLTGITLVFYNDGSVSHVTPVLKYIDQGAILTLNTVTGLSFGVSGNTLVMSGTPSVSLQGVVGRVFLLEFTGNTGAWTMVAIEKTVTT